MEPIKTAKPRGRPRAFDQDKALEQAMRVFWARGFEGASMAELSEALGMNKPSIYGAFGSKEDLFRKALQLYLDGPAAFVRAALQQPKAYQVAESLLTQAAKMLPDKQHPPGCMLTLSALSCGESAQVMREELAETRRRFEQAVAARFARARKEGDLPPQANAQALARWLLTIHQGMSVQAVGGATEHELLEVARQSLAGWPKQAGLPESK